VAYQLYFHTYSDIIKEIHKRVLTSHAYYYILNYVEVKGVKLNDRAIDIHYIASIIKQRLTYPFRYGIVIIMRVNKERDMSMYCIMENSEIISTNLDANEIYEEALGMERTGRKVAVVEMDADKFDAAMNKMLMSDEYWIRRSERKRAA